MTGKAKSRATRWQEACDSADVALAELLDLQGEYQEWLDGLPENLQSSATAEKLQEVCGIDVQGAMDTIADAAAVELPQGFGRD